MDRIAEMNSHRNCSLRLYPVIFISGTRNRLPDVPRLVNALRINDVFPVLGPSYMHTFSCAETRFSKARQSCSLPMKCFPATWESNMNASSI